MAKRRKTGPKPVTLIGRLRAKARLTPSEAADRAGMSRQHWNNIEKGWTGGRFGFSEATIRRVAKALGVRPGDLLK